MNEMTFSMINFKHHFKMVVYLALQADIYRSEMISIFRHETFEINRSKTPTMLLCQLVISLINSLTN